MLNLRCTASVCLPAPRVARADRRGREAGQLAAVFIVAAIAVTLMIAGWLTVRGCLRAVRRRHDRLTWNDLVARNRKLDLDLDKIWRRR